MTVLVQELLVVAIVAFATTYALLKFMPAAWRRSLAASAATWASRAGLSAAHARRVEAKLASGGACGSCDSCRACATPEARSDDAHEKAAIEAASSPTLYKTIPIRRAS